MDIINFAIQEDVSNIYRPFPKLHLTKWKWLTKPLAKLLNYLGAQEYVSIYTTSRIEINLRKADSILMRLWNEKRKQGKEVKCFVVGYNFYHDFVTGADFYTAQTFNCNTPSFRGVTLVLDPLINGALALEFAP